MGLRVTGVFDPLNQGAKGPAPPLEQKSEDRYRLTCTHLRFTHRPPPHTHASELFSLQKLKRELELLAFVLGERKRELLPCRKRKRNRNSYTQNERKRELFQ